MNQVSAVKTVVRGFYDLQKLRIQMGNRIVGNFKVKLGQEPGHTEDDDLSDDAKKILADLRASHKKITDGVKRFPKSTKFESDGVISTYTELCLIDDYIILENAEATAKKHLEDVLPDYPIYEWLKSVKGVGPAMAGVIISEIDIHRAKYPSSLWKYAGLDVAEDGGGRSRKAQHLVEREYINKDGEEATRVGITFNPFLKTKLVGVLSSSFLRAGENKYSLIYRDYKNRLENHETHKEKSKGHRHNMALRYMVKQFLIDLHREWRVIEGYEASIPYHEAKLGLRHGHAA